MWFIFVVLLTNLCALVVSRLKKSAWNSRFPRQMHQLTCMDVMVLNGIWRTGNGQQTCLELETLLNETSRLQESLSCLIYFWFCVFQSHGSPDPSQLKREVCFVKKVSTTAGVLSFLPLNITFECSFWQEVWLKGVIDWICRIDWLRLVDIRLSGGFASCRDPCQPHWMRALSTQ